MKVQRICQHCDDEFTARTSVTKYCSNNCAKRAYKARKRAEKIARSNTETQRIKNKPIEDLKAKEFLKVKEAAQLLDCSVRTVYNHIERGNLKATNLGQRITRIKRSHLNHLFEMSL